MADQKYTDKCSTAWLPVATIASHSNHISSQPGRLVPGRTPIYDHGSHGEERAIQRHHPRRGLSYGSGATPVYSGEGSPHAGRMYYQSAPTSHVLPSDSVRQVPTYPVRESEGDRENRASVESSGGSSEGGLHSDQQVLRSNSQQQSSYHGTPHQSLQIAGICTTPGKCQGGGELSLARLSQSGIKHDVPDGFTLVGTKSPMLPGMTLVAAVDKRYLPDENTGMAMLGFGGNCIGCGAKGFRYFTEFSTHINLRLATQPKKQKHIKYYIITDSDGVLHKGQVIPWRGTEGKKRIYPVESPFSPFSHGLKSDIPSDQSLPSAASGPPQVPPNPRYSVPDMSQMPPPSFERGSSQPPPQTSHYGYNNAPFSSQVPYFQPPKKKSRWESEGGVTVVHSDDEDPQSPGQAADGGELPTKPWLASACGVCPVLLLCQHSIPNIPCNIEDIIISDLLVGCFDPPLVCDHEQPGTTHLSGLHTPADSPSWSSGQTNKSNLGGNQSFLTTPMAILLTIQYFSQLVEDDRLSREDIESLLQDAQLELSASFQQPTLSTHGSILTHAQLPTLANLAATPSKGRVKVVMSPMSLDNSIMRAFKFVHEIHKHNNYKFPKVPIPEFIFILAITQQKAPEFCVLVTSLSQAKYLHEAMIGVPVGARITDNIAKLEQLFRLSSDALEQMVSNFEEVMGYGQLVYIPFNGFPRMKVLAEEAVKLEPKVHGSGKQYWKQNMLAIYATQNVMAKQLLTQVCTVAENSSILDLNLYSKVEIGIVVPCVTTLYNQTARRLAESGLLFDLGLESESSATQVSTAKKCLIQHDSEDSANKLKAFLDKIEKQSSTLFVLIFDQVQFYSSPRGVHDLPYYKSIMEANNIIPLFVTATPYLFQTNCSFIDPDNEIYWTETRPSTEFGTDAEEDDSFVEEPDSMYFGMKEYCDSIKWTHQFPLIRQDDAFERMALRTSRSAEDVDVSVLRCYLLIRHYAASIMWTAGIKPAEPHCSLKTLQIMREIIESPVRNADGSGTMLVIRIPSSELATLAYETLKNTRDRLGFQYRFAIVHDSGKGEFEVEEYFLKRLQMWRMHRGVQPGQSCDDWVPECYQDLLDLPCIVLLSGRQRTGETFPRSLKYIDMRLIDRGFLYRSSLELEFSAIACYIGTGSGTANAGVRSAGGTGENTQAPLQREEPVDKSSDSEQGRDDSGSEASVGSCVTKTSHYSSNYPLPVILISRSAFKAFQTDFYGYPKHLLLSTTRQTRWVGHGRPHLVTTNPAQQSLYYRQWTEPKPKNVATSSEQNSGTVIETRSASGIVISPDIPDVIEDDGVSVMEATSDSSKLPSESQSEEDVNDKPNLEGKSKSAIRSESDVETKKATANNTWQSTRKAMLSQKSSGAPSTSSDSDTEMISSMNDKTDPRESCVKYHPRALLFSGPPQVGKTGAYLHFTRLLQRMLLRLQNVDVYDESSWMPSDTTAAKTVVQAGAKSLWPKFEELAKLPFCVDLTEDRYNNASRVRFPIKKVEVKADCDKDLPARKTTDKRSFKRPLASVILGAHVACDTYHHCDSCKHYREGMGPSAALCYPYRLKNDQVLQFVIPPTCESQFIFTEDGQLQGLRLARVLKGGPEESVKLLKTENSKKEDYPVKTPIMTPSTGRHEVGLLNLYHAMDGKSHVHLVFVKQCEVPFYHKAWPNHIIVGLPVSCDREGLGAARYYIKEFATENYLSERKRQGVEEKLGEDVWPFILMMDDSCVMWQNLLQESLKSSEEEESDTKSKNRYTPLVRVLENIESIPSLLSFGQLGLRQYSSKCSSSLLRASFSRNILNSFILLNVSLLRDIQYDSSRYTYEDVDFSLRVESAGIVTCRLNHYAVLKKYIPTGGKTAFRLQLASGTEDSAQAPKIVELSEYSKLVSAPDREDTHFFSVPAQYLLELYLANAGSSRLFPTSAGKPNNPVLVIDCYVNLGPKIMVEYISSRKADDERKSRSKTAEKSSTKYSGLLLFFCDQRVTAQFLQQFQFTSGARLCLVCQDRNKLRQEVVRLDLEECWRFRLRDEFQTANNPDEPSLFLLTGKHDN